MDLLKDLKRSLLNFSFVIHKMLLLLKNHLNYLKDKISERFFKEYFFFSFFSFFITYDNRKFKS